MAKTYAEKLLDPRWQKKRLEILQRDDFKCTLCGDKETELHIHHEEYSGDPWEAPVDKLKTLCKQCHKAVEYLKTIDFPLNKVLKRKHNNHYILYLLGEYESRKVVSILIIPNDTEDQIYALGISPELLDVLYSFVHQK